MGRFLKNFDKMKKFFEIEGENRGKTGLKPAFWVQRFSNVTP